MVADVSQFRKDAPDRFLVEKTYGAGDTEKTFTFEGRALIWGILLVIPAFDNNPTITIKIENPETVVLFTQAAIADGQTVWATNVKDTPLVGSSKFTLTLSGAPGGTGGKIKTYVYMY